MLKKIIYSFEIFLSFLSSDYKIRFTFLSIAFTISSAIEVLTIILIIPILTSFADTETNFIILEQIFERIDYLLGLDNLLVTKILILYLVIFSKNFYQIWVQSQVSKYGYMLEDHITKRILNSSYYMPLTSQNEQASSELIKNCINDSHKLNLFFVFPFLVVISDVILVSALILFLFIFNPYATFFVGSIVSIIILSYHFFSGRYIYFWGKRLNEKQVQKIDIIQQIFYNLTQIQLTNKIRFFQNKFDTINKVYTRSSYLQQTFQNINKNIYELVLFIGVLLLAIIPSDDPKIILMGAFALAAYKLLPSLNRISSSYQSLQFNIPIIEGLKRFKDAIYDSDDFEKLKFQSLEFKNVSFSYPNTEFNVINELDFKVKKGDFIGIFGDSGSGKTTLLSLIMGLNFPNNGRIIINGNEDNPRKIKFGYVPQNINLINESIKKNIAFGYEENIIDDVRLRESIKLAQLDKFISSLEAGVDTIVGDSGAKLSGGQIQRIGIARALYENPDVIVFDESTNSLDKGTEKKIIETMHNLSGNLTIIFVTHDMSNLAKANKLIKP